MGSEQRELHGAEDWTSMRGPGGAARATRTTVMNAPHLTSVSVSCLVLVQVWGMEIMTLHNFILRDGAGGDASNGPGPAPTWALSAGESILTE